MNADFFIHGDGDLCAADHVNSYEKHEFGLHLTNVACFFHG